MSEQETATVAETPVKVKPAKKPVKKAAPSDNGELGASRIKVLRSCDKPGTLDQLTKKTKMARRAVYHHLWHLRKDGHVKSIDLDVDGAKELAFEQTAKGKKTMHGKTLKALRSE